jgi:hypothetical protein
VTAKTLGRLTQFRKGRHDDKTTIRRIDRHTRSWTPHERSRRSRSGISVGSSPVRNEANIALEPPAPMSHMRAAAQRARWAAFKREA